MAVTKIHSIKATVGRAIKYVTNPDKTNEYVLVDYLNCSQASAEWSFRNELKIADRFGHKNKAENGNQAFHLIQSFKPEETTPEEAHKVGMELVNELLGGRYTAVIGTHIDKDHIHNHIVFCAVDNIEHKRYNDCRETYRNIRKISDRLCAEHGLSVIKEEKGLATSYKEWSEKKKGNSWKQKLKEDINATIRVAKNYDDFIDKIRSMGYQIKGEKLDGSEGKYISYLCPGQGENGRWIRGKKTSGNRGLGEDVSREISKKELMTGLNREPTASRYWHREDSRQTSLTPLPRNSKTAPVLTVGQRKKTLKECQMPTLKCRKWAYLPSRTLLKKSLPSSRA